MQRPQNCAERFGRIPNHTVFDMTNTPTPIAHIAVYVAGNIGDSVLHLGFMRALSEHFCRPLILINSLTSEINRLFDAQPYIERTISVRSIAQESDRRQRTQLMQEQIEALHLDTLFLFTFHSYVAIAAWRAKVKQRFGFVRRHQFYNSMLLSHSVFVHKTGVQHPDTHSWLPKLFRRHDLPDKALYPSLFDAETSVIAAAALCATLTPPLLNRAWIGCRCNDETLSGNALGRTHGALG